MQNIKARAYNEELKKFFYFEDGRYYADSACKDCISERVCSEFKWYNFEQYTGLHDKNGLTEIYEDDIIDENGLVIGNIYEMDKKETDTVIQGFGSKTWCETVSRAILLGCRYTE